MKKMYYLGLLELLVACQSRPEVVPLNLTTLSAAARVIPSAVGYWLLEVRGNPADPDSPHQLILYDEQKKIY